MINPKKVRKTKIVIEKNGKSLTLEELEKLENTEERSLKNFYRGCKHTLEKHFSEAIKWFQLVEDEDAEIMILINAYRIGDRFLFEEYYRENLKGEIFEREKIDIFLQIEDKKIKVNNNLLQKLKKEMEE